MMWDWLNTNAGVVSLVLAVALTLGPLIFAGLRYIDLRSEELRFKKFEIYHNLIRQLVQPETPTGGMYIDRQIAIVFELRNFPEYYELSVRILYGLLDSWADDSRTHVRLRREIYHSIAFMNKKLPRKKRIDLDVKSSSTEDGLAIAAASKKVQAKK